MLKPQSLLSWVVNKHHYTLPLDEIKVSKEQLQRCLVKYLTFQIKIGWRKVKPCRVWFGSAEWFWPSIFAQFAEATAKEQQCRKLCTTAGVPVCFWLVNHNDWSMWFAISSLLPILQSQCGVGKKWNILNLEVRKSFF
jgi:hypothetical protein